jgi:hypothetical protein
MYFCVTVSAVKSEKTCGHLCKMLIDFLLFYFEAGVYAVGTAGYMCRVY